MTVIAIRVDNKGKGKHGRGGEVAIVKADLLL